MNGAFLRRLDRLEAALARLARQEPDFDVARHLTFGEIERGQGVLARYDGDPSKALDAADPEFLALVAAAHARRQGITVAELFPMTRAEIERRLADIERRAASLPKAGEIPSGVREFLAGLSTEQLEAVETFAALLEFGPPLALRPAARLTDAEAVAEWHRLTRRPSEGLA